MPHRFTLGRVRSAVAVLAVGVMGATGLVAVVAAPAQAADDTVLTTGERLLEGDRLVSPSGRYALAIDQDSRLVLSERASTFAPEYAPALGYDVGSLLLQGDGNLVMFDTEGGVLGSFETGGSGATSVRLQDDRNLVFFGAAGEVVADAATYRSGFVDYGEALLPGDVVPGEGGTRLLMQLDGNLVLYRGTTPLWDSRTAGNPGAGAVMQLDGNFVVYSADRRPVFSTGTRDFGVLRVEDTEISVMSYDEGLTYSLWSSNSRTAADPRGANGVVAPGDELDPGEFRSAGSCRLVMQTDGNLVQYCATSSGLRAVFSTGGVAGPASRDEIAISAVALMQADGNFVVYRTVESEITGPVFDTGTRGAGNALVLQRDTNLVVYGPGGRPRWSRVDGPL